MDTPHDSVSGPPVSGEGLTLPARSAQQSSSPDADLLLAEAERYLPVSTLGVGGMGEVKLLRDRRIGREVAMKSIQPEQLVLSDAEARFVREARVQGQLEHPAIVPVYDLGVTEAGPYFTMKRIRGLTFEQIVHALREKDPAAERAYSSRRLLGAMSTVCLAVAFAHARGVLHRDLKPANVMLGAFGEVHVLDWGLAKLVHDDPSGPAAEVRHPSYPPAPAAGAAFEPLANVPSDPGATAVGEIMGTPGFMSPEQAMGAPGSVTARSDIYSLGAILFELLTLDSLHRGGSTPDLLASTLLGADARASVRAPDRSIAPELDAICVKATAKDPTDRYASAREMSEAIERYLDGHQDLERRRAMADAHAAAAEAAARRAEAGDDDSRTAALRQAGAALALLPSHRPALATLARVMLTPPRTIPEAARGELADRARIVERSSARSTFTLYLAWLGFLPVVVWLGIRSVALFASGVALIVAAALAAFVTYRRGLGDKARFVVYALGTAFIFVAAFTLGPLILVPNLAVTNLLAFVLHANRNHRPAAVALALSAVLVPLGAQLLGMVPPSYSFAGGSMTILPQLAMLEGGPTLGLLTLTSVTLVLAPPLVAGKIRDEVAAAEQKSFLDAWSLRQMLPEEAHDATSTTAPR